MNFANPWKSYRQVATQTASPGQLVLMLYEGAIRFLERARLGFAQEDPAEFNLTINNNGYRGSDFRVMSGVSWRMVLDVGNWDASWTINAPGQSGDPASPHYRDLFPLWAEDRYVPMLYSRAAVEAATE